MWQLIMKHVAFVAVYSVVRQWNLYKGLIQNIILKYIAVDFVNYKLCSKYVSKSRHL